MKFTRFDINGTIGFLDFKQDDICFTELHKAIEFISKQIAENTSMNYDVGLVINWLHNDPILSISFELERPVWWNDRKERGRWYNFGQDSILRSVKKEFDL